MDFFGSATSPEIMIHGLIHGVNSRVPGSWSNRSLGIAYADAYRMSCLELHANASLGTAMRDQHGRNSTRLAWSSISMTIGLVTSQAFCDPLQLQMEIKQGIRKHAGMVNDDSRSHDLDWEGTSAGCKSQLFSIWRSNHRIINRKNQPHELLEEDYAELQRVAALK